MFVRELASVLHGSEADASAAREAFVASAILRGVIAYPYAQAPERAEEPHRIHASLWGACVTGDEKALSAALEEAHMEV